MIDVGGAQCFACDECPIVEQLEQRLSIAAKYPEYGGLQFDHCGCDKVDNEFWNGGYCEDAWTPMPAHHNAGQRMTGRAYRRKMHQKTIKKYRDRDNWGGWRNAPCICGRWSDGEYVPGTYIRYPKSSANKVFFKRVSNKKVRRTMEIPPKGNMYRRIFDYWWTID